jgi:hypothetical protein
VHIFADTDLMVFLATIVQIFILGPAQLRKNLRPMPKSFDVETVTSESLSEAQEEYLKGFDEKLAGLNYWPVHTYRAANFGRNLLRSYVNPMEPVRCALMIVEVTANVNGVSSSAHSSTVEFFTYFSDESVLVTRNMKLKSVFDEPPYRITQECPRVTDPAELHRRHITYLEQLNRVAKPPAGDAAAIAKEFQQGHERFCAYQLQRGNLRSDASGNWYLMTAKVHWRGIMNYLNPFMQRFAFSKFMPAALSGIALPVLGSLYFAPVAARFAPTLGMPGRFLPDLVTLTSFALAGAMVGFWLQKSNFLWTFIFTYLGVGAILGFHNHPLPYGTIAALTAHAVAQSQKRQRLILQPTTPSAKPGPGASVLTAKIGSR